MYSTPTTAHVGDEVEDVDPFMVAMMSTATAVPLTLAEVLVRPEWHQDAACRGLGTDAFFPERGISLEPAYAICADCPVISDCRADEAERMQYEHHTYGVWGGESAQARIRDRKAIRSSGRLPKPESTEAA